MEKPDRSSTSGKRATPLQEKQLVNPLAVATEKKASKLGSKTRRKRPAYMRLCLSKASKLLFKSRVESKLMLRAEQGSKAPVDMASINNQLKAEYNKPQDVVEELV